MNAARVVLAAAMVAGCWSVPDATPAGTVVGTWKYDGRGTRPATTTPHTDTVTTGGGMGLELKWSTGVVTFPDGANRKLPLDLEVVVKSNPNGWHAPATNATAFLVNDPLNMKGDPPDVVSVDVNIVTNRGHRQVGGTRFETDQITVRLHGDGRAKQLKEVPTGPGSSTLEE